MSQIPHRSEIPQSSTWDIASVFPTAEVWNQARQEVEQRLQEVQQYAGRLGESAVTLADALDLIHELFGEAEKVAMHAMLAYSVDTVDQAAAARNDQAAGTVSRVVAALSFVDPELMDLPRATLDEWMRTEPRLATYQHYFAKLERARDHTRSAEVEELLGQVLDPFGTASATHGILTNADLAFAPVIVPAATGAEQRYDVAQSTIGKLLSHPDRAVRRAAWEQYADAHLALKNTMANCLVAGVKQDVFHARARRYGSSLEAALAPFAIPVSVFHNLIDTYRRNLPTWHRYWRVRRRALGLETLHEYDIKAPLSETVVNVPYEQSVEWIAAGLAPLGQEYVDIMRRGATEQRWVDIYPNQGKRSGAFSYGSPGTHPFIMMSYTDDLLSMSTLAHELGHSMHSYLTWQTQPLVYTDYSLFAAEVASNFHQAMVRAHLFATQPDPHVQIGLIEEAMANFHRYFFIMPTLARFELELHTRIEAGEAVGADAMNDLMADLFAEGYGDEVELDRARTGSTWAHFSSHLYANFYVYQYATGIAGAHALAANILDGQTGAVDRYLEFLRTGSARDPLDALQRAGVDLTSPAPVEDAFAVLAQLVDRLETLVG